MINICEEFGIEYDVTFNAKKTLAICYGNNASTVVRNIYLNGVIIEWQLNVKYLGNILSHDLSDAADVKRKKGSFIGAVNKLNYVFKNVDSLTKISLFQTYCTAWYGCQSWQLGTTEANVLNVEWRKAVRRTLGLPWRTRSALLPGLAGNRSFCQQHRSRVQRFIISMENCKNVAVSYLIMRAQSNVIGPLGKNIAYLKISPAVDLIHPASQIAHIQELIRMRDGLDQLDVLSQDEIKEILEWSCTS